jgi:hypothetical protein
MNRIDFEGKASRPATRRSQSGSAVLIVLIFLSIMTAMLVSNAIALRRTKVELQMLEQRQQARLNGADQPSPQATGTNTLPSNPKK